MAYYTEEINQLVGLGSVVIQILSVWILFSLLTRKHSRTFTHVASHAEKIALAVAVAGTAISLYYSDIVGFAPCTLCWWQRIFLYPQVILLGFAVFRKDDSADDYIIALSALGLLFAAYNQYLQFTGDPLLPCSVGGASCAKRYVFEFGYMTIPMMSFSAFAFNALLLAAKKAVRRRERK